MLQPTGGNATRTRSQGYVNSWHIPGGAVNSASYAPSEPPRATKRQLNGPASDSEPTIKQERLDPGYERAMAQPAGTVLGSIMPTSSASLPRQVAPFSTAQPPGIMMPQPVQIWARPPRTGNATRQQKTLNAVSENQWRSAFGNRNNNTFGGSVVLVRPGVAVPFLTHDLSAAQNAFGMSTRRLTPVFAPVSSSSGSINSHNNRASNQRVIFLPRSTAAAPQQSSFPTFLPSRPTAVPNVCITQHGPIPVSVPANTTTPRVVFVSRPSTTTTRIISTGTGLTSTVMTSSVSCTVIHARPSAPNASTSDPLAQLKAIIGKRVVEKYVGLHIPPHDLHMPERSKHICQSCGDVFVTEVGLESHMSRHSMLISFSCTSGRLPILRQLFYNPCAFKKFYRTHYLEHGVHAASDYIVVSALDLDTAEYRSLVDARNQQADTAGSENEVGQSLENTNAAQCPTTAADSNSNSQFSVAAVKEIYVHLEVEPDKQENKRRSEKSAKDSGTVVKKTNKNGAEKPSSAANSASSETKLVGDALLRKRVEDFSNALCHNRVECQECLLDCETRQGLAAHFSGSSGKETLRCTDCGLKLPSACSLSSHVRLHKKQHPFVCPECGIIFDKAESIEVFEAHVERHCFHLMQSPSSTPTSNCPRCSLNEADEAKMAWHFIDTHAAVYYKCRSCPKAFVNITAAQRHSENTGHDAQKDTVRKCGLCDAVFKDSAASEMESHVIEHFAPLVKCPLCPITASHSSVVEHLRSCHPTSVLPATTCEVCGNPCASQKELFSHVSTKHIDYYYKSVMNCLPRTVEKSTSNTEPESQPQNEPSSNMSLVSSVETTSVPRSEVPTSAVSTPVSAVSISASTTVSEADIRSIAPSAEEFQCLRCQMSFTSEDTYKRHKAKHRFLEAKKAKKKQAAAKSYEDSLQQVPIQKHKICMRCSQTFDSAKSLNQHINTVHRAPDWHLCHLCADCFSTRDHLQRHVEIQHHGKRGSLQAYVCALCAESSNSAAVSFTVQGMLTKHLRNVHGVPRIAAANMARAAAPSVPIAEFTEQIQDSPDHLSSKIEPVRRLFVAGETTSYQCSRCSFSTEERAEFVAHAAAHSPAVAGAVQCKECAASFTVAPALYRHLRITHRMNCDIDTYLRENGYATRCATPDLLLTVEIERLSPLTPPSNYSPNISGGGRDSESSKESVGKLLPSPKPDHDDDVPGECTVCYRVFTTKQLLRAHMRVHGMAFIQRTRRRLASTSPVSSASQT